MSRRQLSQYPIVFEQPRRIAPYPFWVEHIPFAFFLVDSLRPRLLVELGVQSGNSFNAFCQAVKTLGAGTRCYGIDTWKGDEHTGAYDAAILADLEAYQRREYAEFASLLRMTFDQALEYFSDGSVDLLHIDGYHTYDAVRQDFDTWLPKMSDRGVVLFHDIAVRERGFGVWRLWEEISPQYPSLAFHHGYGLGVLAVGAAVPEDFRSLLAEFQANAFYHHLFFQLGHRLTLAEKCQELEGGFNERQSVSAPVEVGPNRLEYHVEAAAEMFEINDMELRRPVHRPPFLIRGLNRIVSLLHQHRHRQPDGERYEAPTPAHGPQRYQYPLEQWHLSFIDGLLRKVPLKRRRVLDIGCGRGEVAREVIRRVGDVVIDGIDSDLCGLADVQEETGNRLTIHRMDVSRLAFPDAHFDAAYSLNVFEHINDLEGAYRELRRVLKPGGLLYLYSSPIWTSYRGHHFNHWLSGYANLIPPWGHLYLERNRLFEEIARKKGSAVAAEAMTHIFDSSYLNRASLGAHKKFVQESGFTIVELTEVTAFESIEPPSAEYVQRIAHATGLSPDELTVDGLGLLLERA